MTRSQMIMKIADHYRFEKQSVQCMEECAELIQAVSKYLREDTIQREADMVEEMADVYIMIMQLLYLIGERPEDLAAVVDDKLKRQIERIEAKQ